MRYTFCRGVLEFIHKEYWYVIQPRIIQLPIPFFKTLKCPVVQGHALSLSLMVARVLKHYITLIIYLHYTTLLWYFATCTVLMQVARYHSNVM